MSLSRIFSLFCCVLASLGIIGSLKVPLITRGQVVGPGPGFFPLVFSSALIVLSAYSFIRDRGAKKFNVRMSLFTGLGKKALIFFLLNCLLLLLVYAFGLLIAMLVFSLLSCVALQRQTLRSTVLFSFVNTAVFYVVFAMLFKMAFPRGMVFRMLGLGWYV